MSSRQNNTRPVVERRYLDEPDACMPAVELLLKRHAKKRNRIPNKSGPFDPERRSDEIRAKTSKPR